ncbi:hypothetical protein [Streptomyces sp. TRM64462]|uniref:hypothetical protein n=1 Tax=Streptomyces sp. TRM64462 TaxID=2741726 RepID=UPI001586BC43|nr:hypothetical protein [Streptomyces sp. TRM64462]
MAAVRLSISMPAEVRDRIKDHAARLGMDVSTFVTIATQAQMDQQDRVSKVFEPFEQARREAEAGAEEGTWLGDHLELTPEEQAEVNAILGRASGDQAAA